VYNSYLRMLVLLYTILYMRCFFSSG